MDATTRFDTARAGAMPLVCAMFEKLGRAESVNQLVPYEGEVTPRAVVGKKISGKKIVRRISL